MNVVERFLKYVSFDTQSKSDSDTVPSSLKQLVMADYLVDELKVMGIENAHVDKYGIVYAGIPASKGFEQSARIGFIAHMDTSPDMSGEHVNPRIIRNYDGKDILLNEELDITMGPAYFDALQSHIGHDLIVTDGTTLLGADDKAGIAEIMTMVETLIISELPHGPIQIAFTPDEEVGHGADHFDIVKFNAEFAYTVDGSDVNSIDFECFNAANATLTIQGRSIHPGEAKGKMINALLVGMEFHSMLAVEQNPAYTDGYDGFHHLCDMHGECEKATLMYIIRNHNETLFEEQKAEFMRVAEYLNKKYPSDTVDLVIEDSYANMRSIIEKDMRVVDIAKQAMEDVQLTPTSHAIRGGTDGARLTFDGLPCPNLGTGGYNFHGKYEFASINEMQLSVNILLQIVQNIIK